MPGRSTIATLRQGEFLDAMNEGGEFENLRNQALLVMIYHRWDEVYRLRISRAFEVRKNEVHCVLMGDIRLVRNVIVHENAVVTGELGCRFLERIWSPVALGQLRISDAMIHALMEQLNAIQVEVRSLVEVGQ